MDNLQDEIDKIIREEVECDCSPGAYDFDSGEATKRIHLLILKKLREEKEKEIERLKLVVDCVHIKQFKDAEAELETLTNQIKEIEG
jgi:hypothetical protein